MGWVWGLQNSLYSGILLIRSCRGGSNGLVHPPSRSSSLGTCMDRHGDVIFKDLGQDVVYSTTSILDSITRQKCGEAEMQFTGR